MLSLCQYEPDHPCDIGLLFTKDMLVPIFPYDPTEDCLKSEPQMIRSFPDHRESSYYENVGWFVSSIIGSVFNKI